MTHLLAGQLLGKKVSGAGVMKGSGINTQSLPFIDTFDRANGDLGNGWNYDAGKWTISSNVAICKPTLGSELIDDPGFEEWSDIYNLVHWNPYLDNGTITQESVTKRSGSYSTKIVGGSSPGDAVGPDQANITPDGSGFYRYLFYVTGTWNGNTRTLAWYHFVPSGVLSFTRPLNYAKLLIDPVSLFSDFTYDGNSMTAYVDDFSIKKVTALSSMIASKLYNVSDIDISISVDYRYGSEGIVLCLDDKDNPLNCLFVHFFPYEAVAPYNASVVLYKYLNGTFSTLIDGAAAAVKSVRVWKSGTTVKLYYTNTSDVEAQIGTDQTVSDVSIINNKRHGMYGIQEDNDGTGVQSFSAVAV